MPLPLPNPLRRGPGHRLRPAAVVALLLAAATWGAIAQTAIGDHYHSSCVGHGFVHGSSTTDGSMHSRVESDGVSGGCGDARRYCDLYTNGAYRGGSSAIDPSSCNFWVGSGTECASTAHVDFDGVFASHIHFAHNWCG